MNWIEQRQLWDQSRETTERLEKAITKAGGVKEFAKAAGVAISTVYNTRLILKRNGGKRITPTEAKRKQSDKRAINQVRKSGYPILR